MTRRVLADGRWFDDTATGIEAWHEATRWDGNNRISRATGSQWTHERLYRTPARAWILLHEGLPHEGDTYTEITAEDAAAWLVQNEHDAHEACAAEFAALEVQ